MRGRGRGAPHHAVVDHRPRALEISSFSDADRGDLLPHFAVSHCTLLDSIILSTLLDSIILSTGLDSIITVYCPLHSTPELYCIILPYLRLYTLIPYYELDFLRCSLIS